MDRKEMIKAFERHTGIKAKYMGPPSFAYQLQIGGKTYIIDREGTITNLTGEAVDFESLLQGTVEGDPSEAYGNVPEEAANETEPTQLEVTLPMEGHTGVTLRNLVNMIYSKQALIKKVFNVNEDIVCAGLVEKINSTAIQTLEDFQAVITETENDSCNGLEFDFINNTIAFSFCKDLEDTQRIEAYTQFVALLNKSAKTLKHASAKPAATDNDKFTMRVWLIRLGFIGDEFKNMRRVILKSLDGNGAFRKVKTIEEASKD